MSESYIVFAEIGHSESGATFVWQVHAKDGNDLLGEVRWFGRWRCYAYYPQPAIVLEKRCLRDIAEFCETRTRGHMAMKRAKP